MTERAIAVTSRDDLRIAPYLSIRERDLTGRGERFIIEGKVTLGVALARGRFPLESVFIARHRLPALAELLGAVPADVPIFTAQAELFDEIAGFNVHRGILACARKRPVTDGPAILAAPRLLAAVGVSNHDNMGALFRNGAAFGVGGVLLDETCCDPLYRKAIRVSAGTALWLAFQRRAGGADMIAALQGAGHEVWALTPRAEAAPIASLTLPPKLTILVGAEGPGLPGDIIAAARAVRIPMAAGVDSVNVATAAAIALAQVHAELAGANRAN